MVSALNMLTSKGREPLSERVEGLRRYHATGEINFRVDDKEAAIEGLRRRFHDGRMDTLDGVTIEYGDLSASSWWWCNVRPSNTEPLLRLNLEASTAELRDQMRDEVVSMLGEPQS